MVVEWAELMVDSSSCAELKNNCDENTVEE